jgi:hypothetical protein
MDAACPLRSTKGRWSSQGKCELSNLLARICSVTSDSVIGHATRMGTSTWYEKDKRRKRREGKERVCSRSTEQR